MRDATVVLVGNLGAKPETRETKAGKVTSVSMAVRQRTNETCWYRVSFWGKQGEAFAEHCEKGQKVFVAGSLDVSTFEKDGRTYLNVEVNGYNWGFAGGAPSAGGDDFDG